MTEIITTIKLIISLLFINISKIILKIGYFFFKISLKIYDEYNRKKN